MNIRIGIKIDDIMYEVTHHQLNVSKSLLAVSALSFIDHKIYNTKIP